MDTTDAQPTLNKINQMNQMELAKFLRKEISEEKLIILDFQYIQDEIECWWSKEKNNDNFQVLKFKFMNLLINSLHESDSYYFSNLGLNRSKIAAVCIKNIFRTDCHRLSLLVHESLSSLFQLTDIKYDYEEHKALFLKPSGEFYKDWGNGYGAITPHSDDLYENLNIDYLSLTICRDITKTPTSYIFPRDIVKNFNDIDLCKLLHLKAKFLSGKNVAILKERERNIMEYSEKYGLRFFLDFRIDNHTGERMQAVDPGEQYLIDMMRDNVSNFSQEQSIPETGTFLIVANHKVLHGRPQMNIDKSEIGNYTKHSCFIDTPRLLFRSKGPRNEINFYE
ncbi:hypothetical protein [Marivirga sp.]|uniref:hypothetical protein n=1 Tax=Marivirga sp. TaxID=2018662 RepID=UPI0025D8A2DB|nr:hypothetical protein [Marivirga sp.]